MEQLVIKFPILNKLFAFHDVRKTLRRFVAGLERAKKAIVPSLESLCATKRYCRLNKTAERPIVAKTVTTPSVVALPHLFPRPSLLLCVIFIVFHHFLTIPRAAMVSLFLLGNWSFAQRFTSTR